VDLADLREYQYHDDVRHIDWNVTARLQTPYVRVYNEDRDVTAWFLLDLSPSVSFGSELVRKRSVAIDFVTVLARLLSRYGNPVGALFYGDRVDTVIPARSAGATSCTSSAGCFPGRALAYYRNEPQGPARDRPPGHAPAIAGFVVSDFISVPGWEEPLATLARRHEIVAVRLYDPLEMELPDLGLLVVQDAETGEQEWVDSHDRGFRRRFAAAAGRQEAELRSALGDAGVDALELSTADDLVEAILRFADLRKRRRQLSAAAACRGTWEATMTFLWPDLLWLLTAVPALIAIYLFLLSRKKKSSLSYSNLSLLKEAMGGGRRFRRHIPR